MRKRIIKIIMGTMVSVSLLCPAFTASAAEAENTDVQEESVKSYLTGETVAKSIGRRRPVAVMLGNNIEGAPQSGIANAGVVYEAPVEGDITRLMGIFEDYDSLEKIGSVRSCRDYYLFYANEFDALYAHYGQAVYALSYLDQHVIDNLNGLTLGNTAFFRTTDRKAPHNAYTNYEYLQNGISSLEYSQEYSEDYTGHYVFAADAAETTLENGSTADVVRLDNFKHNNPWFEYDETAEKYNRFQFGEAQVDELTGEQLQCDNIILQYSAYEPYDANGYLNVDVMSGGSGKFITRGKAEDIRWEKDSPWGITHYYDENETEISLNTGVTWVEIIQNDRVDSVTYQ